jgi:hypothetical protein
MEVRHVCESCGELLAVHEHANYQQVKDCRGTMRPLCNECASWPGCPLPEAGTRGQEVNRS